MVNYTNAKSATNGPANILSSQPLAASIDTLIRSVSQQIELLTFDSSNTAILQQLACGFEDDRESVHLRIIELFGEIGEDATSVLCQFVTTHHDVRVRQSCIQALALLGDPDAISILVQTLLTDQEALIQSSAAGALARMGESAVAALLEVIADSNLPDAQKGQATWALSSLGEDAALQLYVAVESDNPDVRGAVVRAIATIARNTGSERAVQLLRRSLGDPFLTVRIEAASGLGQLSCHNATPQLMPLLNDPAPEMRRAVALALGSLKDPRALDALQAITADPSDIVRPVVAWAIRVISR